MRDTPTNYAIYEVDVTPQTCKKRRSKHVSKALNRFLSAHNAMGRCILWATTAGPAWIRKCRIELGTFFLSPTYEWISVLMLFDAI